MKKLYQCSCGELYEDQFKCMNCEAKHRDGDTIPVVEVFLAGQTRYENPRDYFMFKRTYLLSDEQLKNLREVNKENLDDMIFYLQKEIIKDNQFEEWFEEEYEHVPDCEATIYTKEKDYNMFADDRKNEKFYAEVHLDNRYANKGEVSSFYFSVFEMPKTSIDWQENISIRVKKYLTDNR